MSEICIIGGGIVGLATARALSLLNPDARLTVLEKEADTALHQSGRNSGVLHTGVYYKPGSLKATTCRAGKLAMQDFCQQHDVPFELCGKVIVATSDDELGRLENILKRGTENGVTCQQIDVPQLKEIEPHVKGVAAIHVPEAGIVDYPAVCRKLVKLLRESGHDVRFNFEVTAIDRQAQQTRIRSEKDEVTANYVVNCAGLYSDHVVRLAGGKPEHRIVPFRGEYYELRNEFRHLCRHLIYPVPDPSFPFLGVHFTRMIDNSVECGPNAVLALAREGYNWKTIRMDELAESLAYRGFQKLALKHWKMGAGEMWRSASKAAFVKALQKLIPDIRREYVSPCRAGVRAQAVAADGSLVDDFKIQFDNGIAHVLNAPSPAATASLQIGEHIAAKILQASF
ncbi:L-2-hydroxyglutarate oxidase [Neorhodopirellula pilleata]|uniref:L-2-hydroxyglutarate oxidase LhgO n=1 Tax=Neorhodopirellula pilleata TaxID=2714738 RepID=A0A5C6A8D3_9BACT|nr:L-2-hydroxyglutarate oxidase [Neorhodopirellula pilleata]TWT96272.1 L-2-hydroxyglutarate oxidase LhgO [Neorhodopirellula pilleata]